MARKAYAKRYSQAVFQIAVGRKELDKWQADLQKIASLGEDAAYVSMLENPRLSSDDKAKLLSERLGDINPLALNLVLLLIARGGLSMVADIAEEYQRLLDSSRGLEPAEVVTAVPLDEEDKQRVAQHLSNIVSKEVVIKPEVDSSLLGGIIARIGGKLLDGSTRGRLEALKNEIGRAAK